MPRVRLGRKFVISGNDVADDDLGGPAEDGAGPPDLFDDADDVVPGMPQFDDNPGRVFSACSRRPTARRTSVATS